MKNTDAAETEKSRILIVDDDRSNLHVLNHILRSDYNVQTAKTGQTGIRLAAEYRPDLILLDVLMPDKNGFEVLVELRSMEETSRIPVIFISALACVEDQEKGFKLGAVDYITKPFNNTIVKARVNTQINVIRQIRTIERLGMIDALTEIPNRRSFDCHLSSEWGRAIRENRPISLLIADVDKFKVYNDTYGHGQGDLVLKVVAKSIEQCLCRPGDYVSRMGGEEFAIILSGTELAGALCLAEKIREKVETAHVPELNGASGQKITISIGVASEMPIHTSLMKDFIHHADVALYQAKNSGRNRVCAYSPAIEND